MGGMYKVIAHGAESDGSLKELKFEFASRKTAVDVRDQLVKAGYEAVAEMTKKLD